ncbi:MAG: phosphoribosylanthranilate isomerase [bacterium]
MPITNTSDIWCKICGVTRIEDVHTCEEAGADAIGFNCYADSARFVDVKTIARLSRANTLTSVALFVDASAVQVKKVIDAAEIDLLQFHGNEAPAFCEQFGLPYMKVLRMRAGIDLAAESLRYDSAWALMLDTFVDGQPGGTGSTFDWNRWPASTTSNWVLAGGLTPQNVAAGITALAPFGVDVSGGVEGQTRGLKDPQKIFDFIQEVRSVSGK